MNMNRMKWCKRKKCIECHTQWMNFLNEKGEDKTEQQQQKKLRNKHEPEMNDLNDVQQQQQQMKQAKKKFAANISTFFFFLIQDRKFKTLLLQIMYS